MSEYIDNDVLTYSGSSHPILYSGQPIFIAKKLDFEPDIIIKRNAWGSAFRNAVAIRDPWSGCQNQWSGVTFPYTPSFFNGDKIMAVRSPYLIEDGHFNSKNCTACTISTGNSSPELGHAVYFDYDTSSTEYIYVKVYNNTSGNFYEQVDITNGGYSSTNPERPYNYSSGGTDILRCRLNYRTASAIGNLSDWFAIRNFYAPDLTAANGFFTNHYSGSGARIIHDGGNYHNESANYSRWDYTHPGLHELENFYAPKLTDKLYEGMFNVSKVKNVHFKWLASFGKSMETSRTLTSCEDLTATIYDLQWSAVSKSGCFRFAGEVNGNIEVTASTCKRFDDNDYINNYGWDKLEVGLKKPTSLRFTVGVNSTQSGWNNTRGFYSALSSNQAFVNEFFGSGISATIAPDVYISIKTAYMPMHHY